MEVNDRLSIRLDIGGNKIQLTIPRQEEEIYRKAGLLINQKLNAYSEAYSDRDKEQLYCMALIDIATNYQRAAGRNDTEPFKTLLNNITAEIETALNEKDN